MKKVLVSQKMQLLPNRKTERYFNQACGVSRFSYNWALAEWGRQYKEGIKPSAHQLDKLFNSVKAEQFPWLYCDGKLVVSNCVAQRAIKQDLKSAFQRFFKKQGGYPKFKSKNKTLKSFYLSNTCIELDRDRKRIRLSKVGWVRCTSSWRYDGKIMGATVSQKAGKWFIALQFEIYRDENKQHKNSNAVGVDLGIKSLAVLSDGSIIENRNSLKRQLKSLRIMSRSFSRMVKGSKNWEKMKGKLQRKHYKVANIRKDILHKSTHFLTRKYGSVVIEDLNVRGMVRNRCLARSISDVGFHEFRRQLEYKSVRTGTNLIVADRFMPSSKTCSSCGSYKKDLKLSERHFKCGDCGIVLDRDYNAACNLYKLAVSAEDRPSLPVEAEALAGTCTGETSVKEAGTEEATANDLDSQNGSIPISGFRYPNIAQRVARKKSSFNRWSFPSGRKYW